MPYERLLHDMLDITTPARPASSVLTEIFTVTPVFAEYAILMRAATLPPATDLP